GGPLMHVIAAKAVAFKEAREPAWREYQKQVVKNAKALAGALLAHGFRLVSGGTDTHLILVDLTSRGVTGKEAQEALDRAWITVNKNTIPFETKSPMVTSGIRLGTPAATTRRAREWLNCHRRYTTCAHIDDVLPHVVKPDGRRERFGSEKLRASILNSWEKRSVGVQAVEDVVGEIESQLHDRAEKEISSEELGKIVMEHLQKLDPVAYVRFASVYRKFKDVGQFVDEVRGLQRDDKAKAATA